MKYIVLLFFVLQFCSPNSTLRAQTSLMNEAELIQYILNEAPFEDISSETGTENPKIVAALLALALGPFGVHRMYLGTELRVPVFYTLTLGGGLGILPLIDFFYILMSKNQEQFKDNGKVFMWGGDSKRE